MIPVMMTTVMLKTGSARLELDMDLVHLGKDIGLVVTKVTMIMVVTLKVMTTPTNIVRLLITVMEMVMMVMAIVPVKVVRYMARILDAVPANFRWQ
uniref:Uncharacterized protein n=1 Tax=Arundo donax TaxID=35708 RepID=A0A0A9D7P2_ARUDO